LAGDPIRCPECGERNPRDTQYCGECGGSLDIDAPTPRKQLPPPRKRGGGGGGRRRRTEPRDRPRRSSSESLAVSSSDKPKRRSERVEVAEIEYIPPEKKKRRSREKEDDPSTWSGDGEEEAEASYSGSKRSISRDDDDEYSADSGWDDDEKRDRKRRPETRPQDYSPPSRRFKMDPNLMIVIGLVVVIVVLGLIFLSYQALNWNANRDDDDTGQGYLPIRIEDANYDKQTTGVYFTSLDDLIEIEQTGTNSAPIDWSDLRIYLELSNSGLGCYLYISTIGGLSYMEDNNSISSPMDIIVLRPNLDDIFKSGDYVTLSIARVDEDDAFFVESGIRLD